jgi:uncharacterized protein YjbJ (UPF0337 family)
MAGEGKADQLKGRVKQAAGDLTGDRDMKREGQVDEAAGGAKEKVGKAKDWVNDKIDDAKD